MKVFKSKMKQFIVMFLVLALGVGILVPTVPEAKAATNVKVTTQKELDEALKNSSVEKITIKNKSDLSLKIKKGTYNADIVIKAKKGKMLELDIAEGTEMSGMVTIKGKKGNVLLIADDKITVNANEAAFIHLNEEAKRTEAGTYISNDGTVVSFNKSKGKYVTGYYNNRGEFIKLGADEKCPYSEGGWIDLNGDYHPAGSVSHDAIGKFYVNWTNNFQRVSPYDGGSYDRYVMDEYGNILDEKGVIRFVDSFLYTIYAPDSGSSGYVSLYYSPKDKPDYFYYDEAGKLIGVYEETGTEKIWSYFD